MMGMGSMMGISENAALFFIEYDDDFENFSGEGKRLIDKLNEETDIGECGRMDFADMSGGLELQVYGDNMKDIQTAIDYILLILEYNRELDQAEDVISEAYDKYTLY